MSFWELFCKRIHETKRQFNTLRLWGTACFVVCVSCILLALHRVCGNPHVTTNNTKRTGPKNNRKKIKIYFYCHTALVIGWFDVLERFSMNFLEEWLLVLYKKSEIFSVPMSSVIYFCWIQQSSSTECYHFMRDTLTF